MTSRYDNLSVAIEATINISKKTKPYRIVDIGVGSGLNAERMIRLAKKLGRSNIEYYGFDMFEDLNDLASSSEFVLGAAISRDKAREIVLKAGAVKAQLIKGNTNQTLAQAKKDIPIAAVVCVDGGASVTTIANDIENALSFCSEGTYMVITNCIVSNYYRGSAFIIKSAVMLKKEYGITIEEAGPVDVISDKYVGGTIAVNCIILKCAAQLTPAKLEGLAHKLLVETSPQADPEPQEYVPEVSFVPEPPKEIHVQQEASAPAGESFPQSCSGDTDIQSVRVCENSCGKLPEEHCELPSDSCGRRESPVGPCGLVKVSEEPDANTPVPEERQEPDSVVEQGNTDSAAEQVPDNSGSELRPEVPPELDKGNNRNARRRRRRGGADDERSGAQD